MWLPLYQKVNLQFTFPLIITLKYSFHTQAIQSRDSGIFTAVEEYYGVLLSPQYLVGDNLTCSQVKARKSGGQHPFSPFLTSFEASPLVCLLGFIQLWKFYFDLVWNNFVEHFNVISFAPVLQWFKAKAFCSIYFYLPCGQRHCLWPVCWSLVSLISREVQFMLYPSFQKQFQ